MANNENRAILWQIIWVCVVLCMCVIFAIFFASFCPIKYKGIVTKYAQENNVDECIIYAIILTESGYRENAVSDAGAVGLMQLLPTTANEIASNINETDCDLTNAETNIKLGCKYFAKMLNMFGGNLTNAICAYNAGPYRVKEWLKEEGKAENESVTNIKYEETRNYLKRVMRRYRVYKLKLALF